MPHGAVVAWRGAEPPALEPAINGLAWQELLLLDSESVASNAGTSADVRVCDYPDVPNLPDCALEAQGAQHLPDSPVAGGNLYMNNDEAFAGGRASG